MAPQTPKGKPLQMTPLWVISLFLSLTETVLGIASTRLDGLLQITLVVFVVIFPCVIAGLFFAILWKKPYVFYPPSEYAKIDIQKYVNAFNGTNGSMVTKTNDLTGKVKSFGKPDRFVLLFKAEGDTWSRSTKAMEITGGCLVQVSTKIMNPSGDWAIGEALQFCPATIVADETDMPGHFLK